MSNHLVLPATIYSPTFGKEMTPAELLAAQIKTNQVYKESEATLKTLKPEVEALRLGEQQIAYPGRQANTKGEFIITHVGPFDNRSASVEVLDRFLAEGILTTAQYAEAVKVGQTQYNKVRFKKQANAL